MNAIVEQKQPSQTEAFRGQFAKMEGEIGVALPAHIPVERFMRVVLTAVNSSPDLLAADRRSLFEAAMKAAQDGLLPDGRDGALVVFSTKVKGRGGDQDKWIKKVQWMPMISGVLKKVRNSGGLSSIDAQLVCANDKFTYRLGLDEVPVHEPNWFGERGDVVGVYAVAKLKDGSFATEIMSRKQVEEVRAISRAKDDGPWSKWWGEMARKTVLRRLSKRLPMSTDLDDLIRRDDDLYDLKGGDSEAQAARLFKPVVNALADETDENSPDALADEPDEGSKPAANQSAAPAQQNAETDTGFADPSSQAAGADAGERDSVGAASAADLGSDNQWFAEGAKAARAGMSRKALPPELRSPDRADDAAEWFSGYDSVKHGGAQ